MTLYIKFVQIAFEDCIRESRAELELPGAGDNIYARTPAHGLLSLPVSIPVSHHTTEHPAAQYTPLLDAHHNIT